MTTLNQAVKTYNARRATEAALKNEQITRERVARLEHELGNDPYGSGAIRTGGALDRIERLEQTLAEFGLAQRSGLYATRSLFGRLKWLLTGR